MMGVDGAVERGEWEQQPALVSDRALYQDMSEEGNVCRNELICSNEHASTALSPRTYSLPLSSWLGQLRGVR